MGQPLRVLDRAGASVVVLDTRLTNEGPSDEYLAKVIQDLHHTSVVLSIDATPRAPGNCLARTRNSEHSASYGTRTPPAKGVRAPPNGESPMPDGSDQVRWPHFKLTPWPVTVAFGSAEFEADSDGVVRSFCPFSIAQAEMPDSDERGEITIPSIAVLAVALKDGKSVIPDSNDNPKDRWSRFIKQNSNPRPGLARYPSIGALEAMDLKPWRIRFIADDVNSQMSQTALDGGGPIRSSGINRLQYKVVENAVDKPQDADLLSYLANHIVIVGSEDIDTRDWHNTPLGQMSGIILFANAIAAVDRNGFFTTPEPRIATLLVEWLFVLVGCLCFEGLYEFLPKIFVPNSKKLDTPIQEEHSEHIVPKIIYSIISLSWFTIVSVAVTFILIIGQSLLAYLQLKQGIIVDLGASIISILIERLIHIGSNFENWISNKIEIFTKYFD